LAHQSLSTTQVELAEALRIGEHADSGDLPVRDGEAEYDARPAARRPDSSGGSVHEGRLSGPSTPGEGADHRRRAADLPRRARLHGCAIGPEHDVWVEHREKRVEVTIARGREEGADGYDSFLLRRPA